VVQRLQVQDAALADRLLDAGVTPAGPPYRVLEHVDGLAIDRHAEAQEAQRSSEACRHAPALARWMRGPASARVGPSPVML
jgi:hypothetical protein